MHEIAKGYADYTKIQIPNNKITTLGELQVGDMVMNLDGGIDIVQRIEITIVDNVVSVTFENGDVVVCGKDQKWLATIADYFPKVKKSFKFFYLTAQYIYEQWKENHFFMVSRVVKGTLVNEGSTRIQPVGVDLVAKTNSKTTLVEVYVDNERATLVTDLGMGISVNF